MTNIADTLILPNGAVVKNRIVKSAMSEALADENNNPSQAHIDLFRPLGQRRRRYPHYRQHSGRSASP